MLVKAKDLIGRTIHATDGDIGSVTTLYFDDDRWTVRYFVVDTGHWLPGRRVLISPFSIRQAGVTGRSVETSLTREQVKNSPDVNTERPISRQHEMAYSDYYGYPYYWAGPGLWGAAAVPMPPTVPPAGGAGPAAHRAHDERNSHLRDVKHVAGYHIQAADGSIGHVEDFLLDTQSWTIRYLIVDTSKWIGGRHVLVAPTWVGAIRWETSQIEVAMTRDAVRRSPEYDARGEVQRSYEDRLHVHYDQPPYWVDDRNGAAHEDVSHRSRVGRLEQFKDLEIADGDTDVRGWKIVASDGVTVGHVKHLIVDRAAMKVRYLEAGLEPPHAGARTRDVLIPLEDIEIEKPAREVRLRSVPSPRLAALPTFSGFPIDPETLAATRTHFAGGAPSADPDQALQPERRRTTSGRA